MGFGVLGWGSPSGPSRPLALTPALSRPAGEPAALCSGGVPLALDAARFAFLWIPACAGMTMFCTRLRWGDRVSQYNRVWCENQQRFGDYGSRDSSSE